MPRRVYLLIMSLILTPLGTSVLEPHLNHVIAVTLLENVTCEKSTKRPACTVSDLKG